MTIPVYLIRGKIGAGACFHWQAAPGEELVDFFNKRRLIELLVSGSQPIQIDVWVKCLENGALEVSDGARPYWINLYDNGEWIPMEIDHRMEPEFSLEEIHAAKEYLNTNDT